VLLWFHVKPAVALRNRGIWDPERDARTARVVDFCKTRRAQLGLTQDAMAARLGGYTRQWVQKFEAGGVKNVKDGMLERLALVLEVEEQVLRDVYDGQKVQVRRDGSRYSELPEMTREIPIVGDVSAGEGSPVDGFVYFPYSDTVRHRLRAVRVKGTCMHPDIVEGDVVVFDADQVEPRNGQLVVVTLEDPASADGNGVVKRWYATPDQVRLIPNSGPEIRTTADKVIVHGVVVELRRRLG